MNRSLLYVLTVAICSGPVIAADAAAASPQVEHGRQLFQRSAKAQGCVTCHSMEGTGVAVGPDLKVLGSVVGPRGLANTIRMSNTCYVQEYTLADGTGFPGIEKRKEGGMVEVWDLTSVPATLRMLKATDIASMKPNTQWQHPPTAVEYNPQELADIIAYVKFASTGVAKEVTPDELH
ncbi:MAG TPA: cytochrome c [Bryobacteraceae bacterium]|nr:cytochrome c [Bryobacteraceae bacterium]